MIELFDAATGKSIGAISQGDLHFLIDRLEEESLEDQDYYINRDTLDAFEVEGCPKELLALLRQGLGNREDMDIRWERE